MCCNCASRIQCPLSVTKGLSVIGFGAAPPARRTRQPRSAASTARWVAAAPNGTISIGSGKRPKHRNAFRIVRNDDHLGRRGGDDLLAQQRAAAALYQCQVRRDLVGAVDGQIELRSLVERRQRDARLLGLGARCFRGRYRHDVETRPRTRSPSKSTKCLAVEPVPSPSRIPGRMNSSARAAAARFCFSTSMAAV